MTDVGESIKEDAFIKLHQGQEVKQYPVEELIFKRVRNPDDPEYLVKWKGYAHKWDEWRAHSTLPAGVVAQYDPADSNKWKIEKITEGPRTEDDTWIEQYCVQYVRKEDNKRVERITVWMDTLTLDPSLIEIFRKPKMDARKKKQALTKAAEDKEAAEGKIAPKSKEAPEGKVAPKEHKASKGKKRKPESAPERQQPKRDCKHK